MSRLDKVKERMTKQKMAQSIEIQTILCKSLEQSIILLNVAFEQPNISVIF